MNIDPIRPFLLVVLIFLSLAFLGGIAVVLGHPENYTAGSLLVGIILEIADLIGIIVVVKKK